MSLAESLRGLGPLAEAFLATPRDLSRLAPLQRLLEELDPATLALASRLGRARAGTWTSVGLYTHPQVELSLFLLPAGSSIPLHDHPAMHAITRVVLGQVRITAWDWEPGQPGQTGCGRARLTRDAEVGASSPPTLSLPTEHNLHRVEAVEDSAFLDLFCPPYDETIGRVCRYYRATPSELDGLWELDCLGRKPD